MSPPAAFVCLLLVAGCGHTQSRGSASTHPGAPHATLVIVTPADGSTQSSTVVVQMHISGFVLDAGAIGMPAHAGHGHIQLVMDGGKYDQPWFSGHNGRLAAVHRVNGHYSLASRPRIVYKQLPPGPHALVAYLANNDLSNTGVITQVRFRVR